MMRDTVKDLMSQYNLPTESELHRVIKRGLSQLKYCTRNAQTLKEKRSAYAKQRRKTDAAFRERAAQYSHSYYDSQEGIIRTLIRTAKFYLKHGYKLAGSKFFSRRMKLLTLKNQKLVLQKFKDLGVKCVNE